MSKQNYEAPKNRARSRSAADSRGAISIGRKPIAFAGQFAEQSAPPPAPPLATPPAFSPTPAPPVSLFARLTQRFFADCIQRLGKLFLKRRGCGRKLKLQEIQQLGEKRFVAIIRVGKQRFLIGGAAASVSLLAEIHGRRSAVIVPHSRDQESA